MGESNAHGKRYWSANHNEVQSDFAQPVGFDTYLTHRKARGKTISKQALRWH
jgi:hypothetical protein